MGIEQILLIVLLAIVVFWLFGMKLVIKFMKGGSRPCPSSLSWIVDLPIRKRYMRLVLERVGVRPGETVLEIGPGPGAFTIDAARMIGPTGKLIAVDIQPTMIAQVEERVRRAGLKNVEAHVADAYSLPLKDHSVDRIFLVTVLPEIPNPVRGLREMHRVLKPGGLLSTTEEFLDPDYPSRKKTIGWAKAAGFVPVERFGTWMVYTLNFKKALR